MKLAQKSKIKLSVYRKNKNIILLFGLSFISIYLFIVSLQGLDLCDEGWVLSFYQQFFQNTQSVKYQMLYYLTGFFGGLWELTFGWGGIISFRILNILTIIATSYITYKTTERYISSVVVLIATLCIVLLTKYGNIVFHHNHFSALLISLSLFFLLTGINKNKTRFILYGGMFVGISFFARVANITLLSFGLLLIVNLFYERNWNQFFYFISLFILGLCLGTISIIGIMYSLGHEDIFYSSLIENLISAGVESGSSHNLSVLMETYIDQYKQVIKSLFIYLLLYLAVQFFYNSYKNMVYVAILTFLIIFFLFKQRLYGMTDFYAFILLGILISCYRNYGNKELMLLSIAGILTMFCLPLGSDYGIKNMGAYSLWLGTFVAFNHYSYVNFTHVKVKDYSNLTYASLVLFVFLSVNSIAVFGNAYFDSGSRLEKKFRIRNNSLANVYSTKVKVQEMDDLLYELQKYVNPGDTMLCFESLPMIQYLTQTVPYMGSSWVWIYDPKNFKRNLVQAEQSGKKMPVVLRQKCQPIQGFWTLPDYGYNEVNLPDNLLYNKERTIAFNDFLKRNNYQIIWENELFQILTVTKK